MALKTVDVLVVGSINMDLVVNLKRAPEAGETVLGQTFHTYPGGKGANQAVAAARLGAQTMMIGCVGDDAHGQELLHGLKVDGVETGAVRVEPGVATGTAVILVEEGGENRIVVVPGANGHLKPSDIDPAAFATAKVVLISQEIPPETVAAALKLGREAGCITVLNPAPARPLSPDLLPYVDVLVPNRSEAALLAGSKVESLVEARLAANLLLDQGISTVVVTMGAQGALAVRENQSEIVPAIPVTPVDTTAAGDAFCGALATALAQGQPLLGAVGYGVAAAAVAVTRPGAQPSLATADQVSQSLTHRR